MQDRVNWPGGRDVVNAIDDALVMLKKRLMSLNAGLFTALKMHWSLCNAFRARNGLIR